MVSRLLYLFYQIVLTYHSLTIILLGTKLADFPAVFF